ncbi:MAG TPA: LysM domain-containing protein [Candidatus Binatia bacterium]|nr:LysM domain-containing protein [Candidatus Binatia bacterium]
MMKRLVPVTILLLVLFACGKKDEPVPEAPPTPAPQTAPQPEPSPVPPPAIAPRQTSPEPSTPSDEKAQLTNREYIVAKGDTLYSIAKKHGLDYRDLAKWNKIKDPRRLRIGQELRLTAPGN